MIATGETRSPLRCHADPAFPDPIDLDVLVPEVALLPRHPRRLRQGLHQLPGWTRRNTTPSIDALDRRPKTEFKEWSSRRPISTGAAHRGDGGTRTRDAAANGLMKPDGLTNVHTSPPKALCGRSTAPGQCAWHASTNMVGFQTKLKHNGAQLEIFRMILDWKAAHLDWADCTATPS
ncbi:MAG: hypothetical protein HPM95_16710 [Alphaproteobacteria bacterium]|nr:hypothetical protein [Alphaproteobacteria bacterium]